MDQDNPRTQAAWRSRVRTLRLHDDPMQLSITQIAGTNSASKLTEQDFLHLRVIWPGIKAATAFQLRDHVEEAIVNKAKSEAIGPSASRFAEESGNRHEIRQWASNSIFSLVHVYQKMAENADPTELRGEVKATVTPRIQRQAAAAASSAMAQQMSLLNLRGGVRTPSPSMTSDTLVTPQPEGLSPAAPMTVSGHGDEMRVNMALLLFLSAICERKSTMYDRGFQWVPDRDVFLLGNRNNKLLEARTDGCLRFRDRDGQHSAAIVEVKPYLRGVKRPAIEWQESAQMAGHIYKLADTHKDTLGLLKSPSRGVRRRVLISQDHSEVYITIASYDSRYRDYVMAARGATDPPRKPSPSTPSRAPYPQQGGGLSLGSSAANRPAPALATPQRPSGNMSGTPGRSRLPIRTADSADVGFAAKIPAGGAPQPQPEPSSTDGFLIMQCYGPWSMTGERDVQNLCVVLMALSLQISTYTPS